MRIPKLFLIPIAYEAFIAKSLRHIIPVITIISCFTIYMLHTSPFILGGAPIDLPALCLFCLFFSRHRFWNISIFFVIAAYFENKYVGGAVAGAAGRALQSRGRR
ncbi:MAG: hypothetical protein AAF621_07240, partial [Pseudomonadota bacterium]